MRAERDADGDHRKSGIRKRDAGRRDLPLEKEDVRRPERSRRRRSSRLHAIPKPKRQSHSHSDRRHLAHQPLVRRRHQQPVRPSQEMNARDILDACDREARDADRCQRVVRIRSLVERLYTKHNPAKLADVEGLFRKYEGQEREMYLRICTLYKVEPDPSCIAPSEEVQSQSPSSSRSRSPSPRPAVAVQPVAKSAVRAAAGARRLAAAIAVSGALEQPQTSSGLSGELPRRPPDCPGPQASPPAKPRCSSQTASNVSKESRGQRRRPSISLDALRRMAAPGCCDGIGKLEGAEPAASGSAEPAEQEDDNFCSNPECGVQLCAGINFEKHPVTEKMYCHDCWFSGGMYLEVEGCVSSRKVAHNKSNGTTPLHSDVASSSSSMQWLCPDSQEPNRAERTRCSNSGRLRPDASVPPHAVREPLSASSRRSEPPKQPDGKDHVAQPSSACRPHSHGRSGAAASAWAAERRAGPSAGRGPQTGRAGGGRTWTQARAGPEAAAVACMEPGHRTEAMMRTGPRHHPVRTQKGQWQWCPLVQTGVRQHRRGQLMPIQVGPRPQLPAVRMLSRSRLQLHLPLTSPGARPQSPPTLLRTSRRLQSRRQPCPTLPLTSRRSRPPARKRLRQRTWPRPGVTRLLTSKRLRLCRLSTLARVRPPATWPTVRSLQSPKQLRTGHPRTLACPRLQHHQLLGPVRAHQSGLIIELLWLGHGFMVPGGSVLMVVLLVTGQL